jgi:uncharacterized membrane protein YhhN
MTVPALGFLGLALAAAVLDWWAVATERPRLERLAKPATLVALIGLAATLEPATPAARPWFLAALTASLAGDALLLLPGRFVAGLVAFLAAHLAYLGGFLTHPVSLAGTATGLAWALVLAVVIGRRIVRGAGERAGLAAPVVAYLGAILAMAVVATGSGTLAAAGAWLFVAGDAALGWDRFVATPAVGRAAVAHRRLASIVPYHSGQLLLTLSLAA